MAHSETAQEQEPSKQTVPPFLVALNMARQAIDGLLATSKERLTGRVLVIALEQASRKKMLRMAADVFTVHEEARGKPPPRLDELKDFMY